jgi:flagellar basal-body rod modification protein FlgD
MAVDPTSGTSGSSSAATGLTSSATSGLDKNAFLQLLVTQLSHQNPLQPQEDGAFIAQLAQFSSLEQLTDMNSTLTSMAAAMGVTDSSTTTRK